MLAKDRLLKQRAVFESQRGVRGFLVFHSLLLSWEYSAESTVVESSVLTQPHCTNVFGDAAIIKESPMAIVRGSEVFSQVIVAAGENSLNRRIHRIEVHQDGDEAFFLEGDALPPVVFINTIKNQKGQNVMRIEAAPKKERTEFSSTTLFLAFIGFVGICTFVIVRTLETHRCFF